MRTRSALARSLALVALCCPLVVPAPAAKARCGPLPGLVESAEETDFAAIGEVLSTERTSVFDENGAWCGDVREAFRVETVLSGRPIEPGTTVEVVSVLYGVTFGNERDGARRFLVFAKESAFPGRYLRAFTATRDVTDPDAARAYADAVRELARIVGLDRPERDRRLAEWGVRCAEARATRDDAVVSLWRLAGRRSDARSESSDDAPFTGSIRDRLAALVARERDGAWRDVGGLVELSAMLGDARAFDVLRGRLEREADAPTRDTDDEMFALGFWSGGEEGGEILDAYRALDAEPSAEDALDARRALVRRFLALYAARDDE